MLHHEIPSSNRTEVDLLAAASSGDESAFAALTEPVRRELHIHCYRMLGSLEDADDALQETMLRAWRQIDRFEPRAPFRAWLYRIATNVCLSALTRRDRRGEIALSVLEEARGDAWKESEPVRLDPYPDRLLDEIFPTIRGPEATIEAEESIELAFVAAVQMLPPRQRATLLLRDVIGYTSAEVATMLETSIAGVNSVLQRARAAIEREQATGWVARKHARTNDVTEQALVRRLVDAWLTADVAAIVSLLTEDALLTMPPQPERYVGRDLIRTFLATVPAGGRLDQIRLVPTRANYQPAVAGYVRSDDSGPFLAHEILVLAFEGDAIASLTRFAGPDLCARFGLPLILDGSGDLPG